MSLLSGNEDPSCRRLAGGKKQGESRMDYRIVKSTLAGFGAVAAMTLAGAALAQSVVKIGAVAPNGAEVLDESKAMSALLKPVSAHSFISSL